MTPTDAMHGREAVTFATGSFEGLETGRRRCVSSIFRHGRQRRQAQSCHRSLPTPADTLEKSFNHVASRPEKRPLR
jgi:hypothetical protein